MKPAPHIHIITTEQLLVLALSAPFDKCRFVNVELRNGAIHFSGSVKIDFGQYFAIMWQPWGPSVFRQWAATVDARAGKRGNSLILTLTSFSSSHMDPLRLDRILELAAHAPQFRGFAQVCGQEICLSASFLRDWLRWPCKPRLMGIHMGKEIELTCEGEAMSQPPLDALEPLAALH